MPYPPKAKATRSNRVGCAIALDGKQAHSSLSDDLRSARQPKRMPPEWSPNGWRRDFALIDSAHVTKRENWGLESGDRFSPHQPNLRYLLAYRRWHRAVAIRVTAAGFAGRPNS
jgi:hypothetical protein